MKAKEVKTMTKFNTGCPHLTGVVYNGYEECEMGKACNYSSVECKTCGASPCDGSC